jgi:hypothetical protein
MPQMENTAAEVVGWDGANIFFAGFMVGCALLQVRMVVCS